HPDSPIASTIAPTTWMIRRMVFPLDDDPSSLTEPRVDCAGFTHGSASQCREPLAELRHLGRHDRPAVALVRVALEVALVIGLGRVPVTERLHPRDDRRVEDRLALEPFDHRRRL